MCSFFCFARSFFFVVSCVVTGMSYVRVNCRRLNGLFDKDVEALKAAASQDGANDLAAVSSEQSVHAEFKVLDTERSI